ncbi:MAG TPA: hypothetical protein PLP42_05140 [Acidobacteriota bacterium]|nr:hypothetical protein [Acidobacteriota bacterium]
MIYRRILDLIEHQPERLTTRWCQHIKQSEVTVSYHRLSLDDLARRHARVFEALAKWLEHNFTRDDLSKFFADLGRDRYLEGFPLCEINYALLIAKRDFWDLVQSQGLLDSSLEFYQAMELMSSIDQFFDLGNFYIIRGYLEEVSSRLRQAAPLTEQEARALIFTAEPHRHPEISPFPRN